MEKKGKKTEKNTIKEPRLKKKMENLDDLNDAELENLSGGEGMNSGTIVP